MTDVTTSSLMEILKEQDYKCALSGRELTPDTCQLDHIDPHSGSGQHVMENCQLVHGTLNTMKGTLSNDEFIQACREVAEHMAGAVTPRLAGPVQPFNA